MKKTGLCLLFAVSLCAANAYNFDKRFTVCHRSAPDLDKCLISAIEDGIRTVGSKGIRALNVPSVDPLKITRIIIGEGSTAVNLVQKYYNASITGLSKLKVKEAHFDLDKNILTFTSLHPTLEQKAKYDINGKILVLPIFGKGDSVCVFYDVEIEHTVKLEEVVKNERKYFRVTDYAGVLSVGKARFDFENLFNGDKALGEHILTVVNENWQVLFEDVKGGIETTFSKVFLAVAGQLIDKIPADEILPN
ncbi:unnamed protein product [Phyllotreta striolata]|uniref:Uncharacterized protein n=1 Tax=Phyllotreta striolata TaxID=444603 RepID=A0A9N9TIY0_PHYSR|nr:unnamed protein product [Phyllotreta striolata]